MCPPALSEQLVCVCATWGVWVVLAFVPPAKSGSHSDRATGDARALELQSLGPARGALRVLSSASASWLGVGSYRPQLQALA